MCEKKWVVVTGASSGIGCMTAEHLLNCGYGVVATARSEEKLRVSFEKYKDNVNVLAWDLSDVESIKEYTKRVKEKVGVISGLVHCAGIQRIAPVHMINNSKLLEVFNINTFAGISLVSSFAKKNMFDTGGASFVLVSSISAHSGADGNSIYASSKGALEGFVSSAASELASKGIRINAIVPGRVQTSMVEEFVKNLSESELQKAKDEYPLGWGTSQDVAYLIEFLLSQRARWITGQNYIIDGGHLVRTSH